MLNIDRPKVETPYKITWWGQQYTCDPRFVDEALGDGNVLLGLQPLNTRPNYYVIRVDSSWHLSNCRKCEECPDYLVEHIDEIYEAIEGEYGEVESILYDNEEALLDGEPPESEGWPVLDLSSGSSWFVLDPEEYFVDKTEARHG